MSDISIKESEEFQTLLDWLSEDREKAAAEYIKIRDGLMRFFRFKGCSDTQTLADETLDRVAKKIHTFDESGNVKKITIIYGFANNVSHEHLRKRKNERERLKNSELNKKNIYESYAEENELGLECMNVCLRELSDEDRAIFIEYYAPENAKNSVARKKLAGRLGCEMNALHVRVFRIRKVLMKCIEKCMKKSL